MNPRLIAACIAAPLVLVLGGVALAVPLPFASYSPGPTFNILGKDPNGAQVVQVDGHKAYYGTGGQLRFTTVEASGDGDKLSLGEALSRWFDHDDAVLPYDYVHPKQPPGSETEKQQGAVEMVTSQDFAKAAALHELGYQVRPVITVRAVSPGTPADGKLEVGDILKAIDGKPITSLEQVVDTIKKVGTHRLTITVVRDDKPLRVPLTPQKTPDGPRVGITQGVGYAYPFEIDLHVDPNVGGPSAGLMFSLAIYDTLTPGSMTNGKPIAGTGTINPDGSVGPIGGIQQKIPAALHDGAKLFLVPADNCADAAGADHGDMRMVKVTTMDSAVTSIEAWAKNPDVKLPTCGSASTRPGTGSPRRSTRRGRTTTSPGCASGPPSSRDSWTR